MLIAFIFYIEIFILIKVAHKAIMNTEYGSIHTRGLGTYLKNRPIFTYNGNRIKDPGASAWRRAKKKLE